MSLCMCVFVYRVKYSFMRLYVWVCVSVCVCGLSKRQIFLATGWKTNRRPTSYHSPFLWPCHSGGPHSRDQLNRQRQHCCSCSFAVDIWPCHVFCYFRLCHSKSLLGLALGVDKIFTLLVTFLIRNVAQGNCNQHQNRNAHYNADQYYLVVDALIGVACKKQKNKTRIR